MIEDFLIPTPPILLQEKIVTILDHFTSLVSSAQNGLPAEITARRQQYEYYRNKLLTFKELKAS
jgi:type I restriction enzyme S subunit